MKNILLTLFFLMFFIESYGQKVGYRYYLKQNEVNNTNSRLLYGDPAKPESALCARLCSRKVQCDVIFDKGNAIVDVFGFKSTSPLCDPSDINTASEVYIDQSMSIDATHKLFYSFSRTALTPYPAKIKLLYKGFNYGLITTPLKIRPGFSVDSSLTGGIEKIEANASGSYNLGFFFGGTMGNAYISYKGVRTFSLTLGGFVGPTIAELKKGTVTEYDKFKTKVSNNESKVLPGLTYGICAIGAINNMGIVFSVGLDSPFGNGRDYWLYSERIWMGFGIVASLPL